jgi:hypothetical protein
MMKGGVRNSQASSVAAGVRVQTSIYGVAVPLVYGRTRATPKLIWLNDFHASKVSSGKKGGGMKGKGGDLYDYTVACDLLLGHYPLRYVGTIWKNKDIYAPQFVSTTASVSDGQVTLTSFPNSSGASSLIAVLAVTLETNIIGAGFNDYGAPSSEPLPSGTWQVPLWNAAYRQPDTTPTSGNVYTWQPSQGAVVTFPSALNGQPVTIYYAYWTKVAYTNDDNQTAYTDDPMAEMNLEFEPYLASGSEYVNHPDEQIPYNWVSGLGSPKFDLGEADSFPEHSFEVGGAFELWPSGDCDPADIITDLIMSGPLIACDPPYTGQQILIGHGLNLNNYSDSDPLIPAWMTGQTSILGDQEQTLSAMRAYCRAYGISCALYLDSQRTARDVLQELFDVANTAPVWSGTVLKAIPYCEVSAAGNGAIYTALTASGPVADLDDTCFVISGNEAPVEIDRNRQADANNVLPIEHLDRSNSYNTTITTEVEQRSVAQFGARKASTKQMHSIHQVAVAQKVGSALVKRAALLRNTYKFKLPVTYSWLEAMDLVTITDPWLGLTKKPVRLTSVSESWDDKRGWELACEAEDFIYGLNEPTPMDVQTVSPFAGPGTALPGSVSGPVIFEPPQRLIGVGTPGEIWIVVNGQNANYGGCGVFISLDGINYNGPIGVVTPSPMGTLTADFPAGSDPDTADTLQVQLIGSSELDYLVTMPQNAADAFSDPCYVGASGSFEIVCPTAVTQTGSNTFSLGAYLRRGVGGTPIIDHPVGAVFAFINTAPTRVRGINTSLLAVPIDPSWLGKTLHFKFPAFNLLRAQQQDLSECTDYTYTLTGKVMTGINGQYILTPEVVVYLGQNGQAVSGQYQVISAPCLAQFASGAVNYNQRSFLVPDPGAGQSITYYVTVYDPNYTGDSGSQTNLPAYCDANTTRANTLGYVALGQITIYHPGSGGSGIYVSPTSLPQFVQDVPYSYQLPISGGTPPYTVSLVSTDLGTIGPQTPGFWPAGISMSSSGLISGTPQSGAPGYYHPLHTATFVLQIVDSTNTSTNATVTAPFMFGMIAWT